MSTRRAVLGLIALSVSACATPLESKWRNPSARPIRLAGQKVVTLCIDNDPTLRRRLEDSMVVELNERGAAGSPAYQVLDKGEIRDREAAKRKLESLGFAGAVVIRVVGSQNPSATGALFAGPQYRHLWGGYWDYAFATVNEPGYLAVDRVVSLETLVYSLPWDELVWAGVSRTMDRKSIGKVIGALAYAVADEMTKVGLLASAKPDDWGSQIGTAWGLGP
jgi:hypothetical protein